MSSRRRAIAAVLAFVLGMAVAGSALAIDNLAEAFRQALSRNPDIAAAGADVAAARAAAGLASTATSARIFADARLDIGSRSEVANVQGRLVGTADIGLGLAQPLYDGGRANASARSLGSIAEADGQRLRATQARVLFDTASAYLSLMAAAETLAIRQDAVQVLGAERDNLRRRLDAFEVTTTEVALLEAAMEEGHALVDVAREALEEARIAFRLVVGADASFDRLRSPGLPAHLPPNEAQAIARAVTRNPLVTAALRDAAAASARIDVARLETAPSIDLVGRLSYRTQTTASSTAPVAADAGIRVVVPLFDGGADAFRRRIASEQYFAVRSRVDQARALVRARVTSAWQRRQRAATILAATLRREAAAREALDGTREEVFFGQRTPADVTNAIRSLADARDALVSARLLHAIASYEIAFATGDLVPEALATLLATTGISFRSGAAIPMPSPPPPSEIPLPPTRALQEAHSRPGGDTLFESAVARLLRPHL